MLFSIISTTSKYYKSCIILNYLKMSSVTMENSAALKMKKSERLSQLIHPINYKLKLNPDLEQGIFQGNVHIQVQLKKQKDYLNLHMKNLNIKEVKLFKGMEEIPVTKFHEITELEQLLIQFDSPIEAGCYNLSLDYQGTLTGSIVGFYSSRFKDRFVLL